MVPDDSLRIAGGAARVCQIVRIELVLRSNPLEIRIALCQEIAILDLTDGRTVSHATRIVDVNHQRVWVTFSGEYCQCALNHRRQFTIDEKCLQFTVTKDECHTFVVRSTVEQANRRPTHWHTVKAAVHRNGVWRENADCVTTAKSKLGERRRNSSTIGESLRPRHLNVILNKRFLMAINLSSMLQQRNRCELYIIRSISPQEMSFVRISIVFTERNFESAQRRTGTRRRTCCAIRQQCA